MNHSLTSFVACLQKTPGNAFEYYVVDLDTSFSRLLCLSILFSPLLDTQDNLKRNGTNVPFIISGVTWLFFQYSAVLDTLRKL